MTPPRLCRLWLAALVLGCAARLPAADPALELKKGDVVAVIGNTLADRMQHDAWLDTYLHAAFPKHDLAIRHMGFSGDEVGGFTATPDPNKRLRSANFGSNDDWMTRVKATVVFAFFGYNESFAGPDGVDAFKKNLTDFVRHTKAQKYDGTTAPRLVLFSPISHENLKSPDLPDGTENNTRLALYTAATAEVAKAEGVPFVDLFAVTNGLYAKAAKPLTINGIHLTADGNKAVAAGITATLFGPNPLSTGDYMANLRRIAQDRNFHWFQRFRTTDGYSIYGGRADLRFVGGQTNRVVAQREMEVLDAMTANRDKAVWAAADGTYVKLDDSNTPEFIPVATNKPGPLPGGKHAFLGGEEAVGKMTVGKGLKVNLFADEKLFPDLVNPVQMSWDPAGRLWVAVWPTYPHWKPKEPMNDKLLVFEDTNGDGQADKVTTFADDLHNPTGFEFYNGGVLVAQAPDLVFLKDTDGDGKADVRERVLSGLDSADTHHTANSFVLDPGGALYFQEGTFHHSQIETPYGPPQRVANGAVFRYEPRAQKPEVYVTYGFANPHGHAFDRWGQDIVVDGTGANPYHGPLFSGYLPFPQKHGRPPQVYQQRTRPCPGIARLSSLHFPEAFQQNLIVPNVIGFQGILRYRIDDDGSTLSGTELEPMLSSTDANFRPSDLKVGPDGALYFIDWHNPIIGHMQHNLRDPSRDKEHGRIYRVTHDGRPLSPKTKIAGEPLDKLLELLKHPEDGVRTRAKVELGSRPAAEVIAAAKTWLAGLDKSAADFEHHRTEALWLHQWMNVADVPLLKAVLASPDFRARAAAVRVLCAWRDRVPDALELLKGLAADDSPRVRLEAVRAASFFAEPEAIEVALVSSDKPTDPALDHVRAETLKALNPLVKSAIAAGKTIKFSTPAGTRFFLRNVATEDLLKMPKSAGVFAELLARPGVRDDARREAVAALAKDRNASELAVLLDAMKSQDGTAAGSESVAYDLLRLLTGRPADQLATVRADLEKLASSGAAPLTRQLGYVALVAADGASDRAWALAAKSPASLREFVAAVPQLRDPGQRAALYPKLAAILASPPPARGGVSGRFVRVELPGKQRTLTLAEVEVMSDGRNVAPQGKATQKSTSNGGTAERAIDGNKSGTFGDGGQTHSKEGDDDPWWELDLGADTPIDSVTIYNRTEGGLADRLKNYTVLVLDGDRRVTFQKEKLPTPKAGVEKLTVGGESAEHLLRQAAMVALTSVRGKEPEAFRTLARYVVADSLRPAAVAAIQRIPVAFWPKEDAKPLLAALTAYVKSVPTANRTAPAVVDALQFADALAGLLPRDEAKAARKELGDLGVRVVRVGTLTDQLLFDKDRLVVQAGKPVEFVFENTDIMPHNFVVTKMGDLVRVGEAAEAFGTDPKAVGFGFVPPSVRGSVLLASKLLQPRESQTLRFDAPTQPGVYPYVCTYPGHWRRMFGALYVVPDLEEYLADPEAAVTKLALPVKDDALKLIRPRTEWTLADLAPAVDEQLSAGGRSFANGKHVFQVASCAACHKFGGAGNEFGPDLTALDAKVFRGPKDVLDHVLDPSKRVEDKYRSYTFNLAAGGTVTGMVLEKSAAGYKVVENPLAKAETRLIKPDDLDGPPKPAASSLMPKGLLDKLTKDEILDLLAYVAAKADPKHPVFTGGHGH